MNLLIDSGNTLTKIAVFDENKMIDNFQYYNFGIDDIIYLKLKFESLNNCILSSVTSSGERLLKKLKANFNNFINLDSETKIPVENLYFTKETLGSDRIALVVGANNMFPCANVLVIDAGSAITFDFINNNNQYSGGNISPGLSMRFKALNKFTGKLPLLNKSEEYYLFSNSTEKAIISGVQKGLIYEIEGYVKEFQNKFEDLKVILTGGDSFFFENKLKIATFAEPYLIFYGLNRILEYNGIT
jgi:type III pantothenate kinase